MNLFKDVLTNDVNFKLLKDKVELLEKRIEDIEVYIKTPIASYLVTKGV